MDPRILHLTFYKCGSQWIRDVLTAPEILAISGFKADPRCYGDRKTGWMNPEPLSVLGPVYNCPYAEWAAQQSPELRTLVVLRDPRDLMISWIYSVAFSHEQNRAVTLLREPLQEATPANRVRIAMSMFGRLNRGFRSWVRTGDASENLLITTYEKFIADQQAEFRRVFAFLGWSIPAETLRAVVERLSFSKRSGRNPGEENTHSHYRKGIAGDWRNHFTRELGALFEECFGDILIQGGWEKAPGWSGTLPETLPVSR